MPPLLLPSPPHHYPPPLRPRLLTQAKAREEAAKAKVEAKLLEELEHVAENTAAGDLQNKLKVRGGRQAPVLY